MLRYGWLCGLATVIALFNAPTVSAQAQREGVFSTTVERSFELSYLLHVPDGYDDGSESYPLRLFLHGSGERGSNLEKVKVWGVPKRLERGGGIWDDFPAIVVSPQLPGARNRWDADELLALLDSIEEQYRVDPDRIYVTGLSMGGYGTWELAERAADRFAAVVPICGGYPYVPIAAPRALGKLPVWAFHGDMDPVVPVDETLDPCRFLKKAGGDVQWTIFEGVEHVSWPMAYDMDELWAWLFKQDRGSRKPS